MTTLLDPDKPLQLHIQNAIEIPAVRPSHCGIQVTTITNSAHQRVPGSHFVHSESWVDGFLAAWTEIRDDHSIPALSTCLAPLNHVRNLDWNIVLVRAVHVAARW